MTYGKVTQDPQKGPEPGSEATSSILHPTLWVPFRV